MNVVWGPCADIISNQMNNLVANAMPPTPPAVHCVLCGDALWKTVMIMDGMLANFLTQLFRLLCAVKPTRDKKTTIYKDVTLANFFMKPL